MKKSLILLLMLVLAFSLFADDAKVLPKGVIRAYVVPSYVFGSQAFDTNGNKVDYAPLPFGPPTGDYAFFNLGGAVEFGLTDWATLAAQWAPGTNLYSDFANIPKMSADGAFELFAGAKLQFVGEKGLSQSDTIRFALAPGVMIPLVFSYDADAEIAKVIVGLEDYNVSPADGAFGLGARIYADYIVNEMFFINIYGEFIKYLAKDAAKDFAAALANAFGGSVKEVNYGYQLTGELELNFTKPIGEGLSMSAGLPVGYVYTPETVFDAVAPVKADASYVLSVNPNASLFVTSLPLPLEFKVAYRYPLMGQNAMARNILTAQIKAYMKF